RISLALSFVLHLAPLLPTLFPYTTLFRSPSSPRGRALRGEVCATEQRHAQYGAAANSGLGPNSMHGFSDWHSPPARSNPLPVPGFPDMCPLYLALASPYKLKVCCALFCHSPPT